jgi:ribosome biogenesis GTPase A
MQKLEMKRDDLEIGIESFQNIKLPTRPPWTVEMTKEEVEGQEEEYFKEYVTNVQSQIGASFFEQNLQVWRQLWRVVEMSDVVLVVCDVRNPLLHFPPSLYDYIINQHQKQLILVLNKIDLVDDETVHAWKEYLQATYPEIIITTFSCSPKTESRVNCKRFYRAVGVLDVLEACKNLKIRKNVEIEWDKLLEETKRDLEERERLAVIAVQKAANGRAGNRDIKSKHPRRRKQFENMSSDDDEEENSEAEVDGVTNQVDQLNMEEDKHDSYVTIGLIGQPNVGKSSLIVIINN